MILIYKLRRYFGFSNCLDQVQLAIKEKNKIKTAENFAKMYSFVSEFANASNIDETKKKCLQTKSNVINAYAYVESEIWDKVQAEIISAEKGFIEIMNNIGQKEEQKKYGINKTYILIEELKNSLSLKDKGIFYIKYKNFLGGINTLI